MTRGRSLMRGTEQMMGMTDAVWARHANPLSVYTRIPILALLALSIFARVWIGWWCLVPVTALAVWTFVNPRAFPPPARLDRWASRAVLGERLYLDRARNPIPRAHAIAGQILAGASGLGLLVMAYGLLVLDGWATVAGVILASGAKLWFVDRMAFLYDEMAAPGLGARRDGSLL